MSLKDQIEDARRAISGPVYYHYPPGASEALEVVCKSDYDALAARLAEVRAAYSRYLAMTDAHLDSLSARLTDAERLLTAWHLAYHSGAGKEGIDDDTTTWLAGITVSADEVQR